MGTLSRTLPASSGGTASTAYTHIHTHTRLQRRQKKEDGERGEREKREGGRETCVNCEYTCVCECVCVQRAHAIKHVLSEGKTAGFLSLPSLLSLHLSCHPNGSEGGEEGHTVYSVIWCTVLPRYCWLCSVFARRSSSRSAAIFTSSCFAR